MITAQYTQGKGFSIGEAKCPEPGDGELLVKVEATSICGTDVKIVNQGHRKLKPGQTIILGHEFAGVITQGNANGYKEGTRVGIVPNIGCGHCEMCGQGLGNMCQNYGAFGITFDGSHTEYVRIPTAAVAQGLVIPLPAGLSPLDATLAEPLSCVVNSMRAVRLAAGESVVIYGAGPMGMLNLLLAKASGASAIYMVDINDTRLTQAVRLGATATCNSSKQSVRDWILDLTKGRGVDVAVTAVPLRTVQQEALELLAPFGRLSLFAGIAGNQATAELNTNAIHYKNLCVTGTTGGSPRDYRTAIRLIESGRVDVRGIVSHRLPITELQKAYDAARSGEAMKIVMADKTLLREANTAA